MTNEMEALRSVVASTEQKLALAETRAQLAEEFVKEQAEELKRVQSSDSPVSLVYPAFACAFNVLKLYFRLLQPPQVASPLAQSQNVATKEMKEMIDAAISQGVSLWKANKKTDCFLLYKTTAEKIYKALPAGPTKDKLKEAIDTAVKQPAATGAVSLRKALDLVSPPKAGAEGEDLGTTTLLSPRTASTTAVGDSSSRESTRMTDLQQKLEGLRKQAEAIPSTPVPAMSIYPDVPEALREATERYQRAEARIEELERRLEEGGSGGDDELEAEQKLEEVESPQTSNKSKLPQPVQSPTGPAAPASNYQMQQKIKVGKCRK